MTTVDLAAEKGEAVVLTSYGSATAALRAPIYVFTSKHVAPICFVGYRHMLVISNLGKSTSSTLLSMFLIPRKTPLIPPNEETFPLLRAHCVHFTSKVATYISTAKYDDFTQTVGHLYSASQRKNIFYLKL